MLGLKIYTKTPLDINTLYNIIQYQITRADPGFSFGGGGGGGGAQKIMCPHAHYERFNVLMLSLVLSEPYFKHSDNPTKIG